MTRNGLAVATAYGAKLPGFRGVAEARRALYAMRDELLAGLANLSPVPLDRTPDSLFAVEKWFFKECPKRLQPRVERALGIYLGAVAVRHANARWVVSAFPFKPGTYELGIEQGLFSLMGIDTMCIGWRKRSRGSLTREYRAHFVPAPRRRTTLDAAGIEAAIVKILARKSKPHYRPWDLARAIEAPRAAVDAVFAAMEKRERLVRVDLAPGRHAFNYALAGAKRRARK